MFCSETGAQRGEGGAKLIREEFWLLPSREMAAFRKSVVVDEFGIGFLGPTFRRCDDLVELRNSFRAKDVEGRVIKRHAPIRGRSSRQKNLFSRRCVAHLWPLSNECSKFILIFGLHIRV